MADAEDPQKITRFRESVDIQEIPRQGHESQSMLDENSKETSGKSKSCVKIFKTKQNIFIMVVLSCVVLGTVSRILFSTENIDDDSLTFNDICEIGTKQCDSRKSLVCNQSRCQCDYSTTYWNTNLLTCLPRVNYSQACQFDNECLPTLICPNISGVCNCSEYLPKLVCNCENTKYYDPILSQCVNRASIYGSCITSANYTCLTSLLCYKEMARKLIIYEIILIILNIYWCDGTISGTRDQIVLANFKAQLSKARTLKQALAIYADSSVNNKHQVAMQTDIRKLEKNIDTQLSGFQLAEDDKLVPYVNGGCLPRITCVPVYTQEVTTGGIIFPNCVEVHRCSGCCQEAQFSCEPTKIEYISFSPIVKFEHGEGSASPIAALQPFKTENHTECTCKCKLDENACPSSAQILDRELCRCREQACFPQCQAMQRCQLLNTQEKPSCVCKRPIPGQNGAHSCSSGYQPDARCKKCMKYP
ncbi:unnamed protein product [Adineta steineri]|uniref:Platelet-derived growth factor (PDGF) family profile domain-containing protein n=1 Tax=Adineta steineri TaxID=433720 RepID=A0A813MB67_9BILA|nr:unnamed protein product [Adineta steineri]